LARVAVLPPGLTTTFHCHVPAAAGIANEQVILVGETTLTLDAAISVDPIRVSFTVAGDTNPVPVRFVIATVVPWIPLAGVIDVTVGEPPVTVSRGVPGCFQVP